MNMVHFMSHKSLMTDNDEDDDVNQEEEACDNQ